MKSIILNDAQDTLPAIFGLGAGGHARSVLEAIRSAGIYAPIGLIDDNTHAHGTLVLDVLVRGGRDQLDVLRAHAAHAFVGVGGLNAPGSRERVFLLLRSEGFTLPEIIDARAHLAPSATLGSGAQILAGSVVDSEVVIGENTIVNLGAVIAHQSVVGAHAHIAPGAILCGDVTIGQGTHIGAGAVVLEGRTVGANVMVGAGAVVTRDIADGLVVIGTPARPL